MIQGSLGVALEPGCGTGTPPVVARSSTEPAPDGVETMSTVVRCVDHPIAENIVSETAPMPKTALTLLANIGELAPDIAARAAEIEAGRRLPPDLVDTLKSIGVFRLFVPQTHGGLELEQAKDADR